MRHNFTLFSLSFLIALTAGSTTGQTEKPAAASATSSATETVVRAQIRNVDFHLTDRIVVHIASLDGRLTSKPGEIPVFDDKSSFGIDVDSAKNTLSMTALTNDLNDYVFSKPDAPLKKLSVSVRGDELVIKGLLVSKGGIPFETSGTLSATPEGMIRVHTTKVSAVHLPVKGLMDLLGLDTQQMINTKKIEGVTVDKDDLILDPAKLMPPPEMHGHLTYLKIENGAIDLTFGPGNGKVAAAPISVTCPARNYLFFKGGSVRFGKLTMSDTDLELIDASPADPFDFSIEHYNEQLAAGYAKITLSGGLCAHVPDYEKLKQPASAKK
jgi:hypothetical protein